MTDTAVAADLLKALDVHSNFTSQITFYDLGLFDHASDLLDLVIGQISDTGIRVNTGLRKDTIGRSSSNAIDIGQTYLYSFVSW